MKKLAIDLSFFIVDCIKPAIEIVVAGLKYTSFRNLFVDDFFLFYKI